MIAIVKRPDLTSKQENGIRLAAVAGALVFASLMMALMGYNPVKTFSNIIIGSVGTFLRFESTVNKAIPLACLSLGVAIAFKMKFYNIGAEGQFYMGAMGASWVAFNHALFPSALLLPLMGIAALVCGGLWALIPALLKSKLGTNEILVTLMLNYIAVKYITYLQYGPWKDPKSAGFAKMPRFTKAAILPDVLKIHAGWVIVLVVAILIHILLTKSKLGYQISVMGESEVTAKYAGISVGVIMVVASMLSGGLCGMAGFMQASAIEKSLTDQLSAGLGFTAVIVAWLARLSAPAILVVSFLFAALLQGSNFIQTSLQIPSQMADVLQGIILFFVLGSEFFLQYRFVIHKKAEGGVTK